LTRKPEVFVSVFVRRQSEAGLPPLLQILDTADHYLRLETFDEIFWLNVVDENTAPKNKCARLYINSRKEEGLRQ
jgi:hypothetical protein